MSIDACAHDVRHSVRTLRMSPAFTLMVIVMLGLGIGINAAVFTVIDAALFKGSPLVHQSDRIVQITTSKDLIYYPDFEEWRSQATSFEGIALVRGVFHTLSDDGGDAESYFTTEVTANTFHLLGVAPMLGRDFGVSDEQPGAEHVVILRYEMWERRFAAHPDIVGRTIRIDGVPARIIGVMPRGFAFPSNQDLWAPLIPPAAALRREVGYARYAYARMSEGTSIETARANMDTIATRLERAYPRTNQGVSPVVRGFEEWFVGTRARALYRGLWGAVAFVLLIVCANVASLMVERAIGRSHEIAVRLALGAGRWRIIRACLVESVILSILGGAAGWWIAKAAVYIYTLAQVGNDMALGLTMDHRVVVYFVTISLAAGLLAGLAAASQLTRLNINSTSKDGGRGTVGGKHAKRTSALFVGAEMVLAVVLLASAGVIVRSFLKVYAADVGVDSARVLTMSLYVPPDRYTSPEARLSFYRDLGRHLQGLPGVESVGFGTAAPADYTPRLGYQLADAATVDEASHPTVGEFVTGSAYFQTLGARLVSGRYFDDSDRASSMPVAIVNERFAARNWPGEVALGKRFRLFAPGRDATPWLTVVGVVSNIVQNDRTRQAFEPLVYVPHEQQPQPNMFAFIRTSVAPGSLAAAVRRQVYAMDATLPVPALWPLAERFDRAYAFERNVTGVLVLFAVVALIVASIGLYATISSSVHRRVQEIGIRMAIGATRREILALVFKQGSIPVGIGLAIGLTASLAVNLVFQSALVGVSPADPVALLAASGVLVLSTACGCWIPARWATRVDPIVALRHE